MWGDGHTHKEIAMWSLEYGCPKPKNYQRIGAKLREDPSLAFTESMALPTPWF